MTSEENTCQSLEELEEENIGKLQDMLKELYEIWRLVGVDDDQKLTRANVVWSYLFNLSKEIVDEENGFYEDIKERIKNYEKKISELCMELNECKIEAEGTLVIKEEILRQELDKLSKLKHKRIKEYQELHAVELKYCKLLGAPPLSLSSTTGVPSEKDLYELGQQVNMLKEEKERRYQRFCMKKKELTTILEITELTPESSVEKEILSSKECPSLSSDTFKILDDFISRTKIKKADLENEKKQLMEKLSVLWDRLNINKSEREIFLSRHNDCRVSSLNAVKQEIARCEEIKLQNIKQYIESLKEELLSLWEKCFISESERHFPLFDVDDANEAILEACDNEVAKWRKYYKDIEHVIAKIQKRHKLWDLMIVFENKATDPNRFKNRRGNLLQEERERKKLQKDLPNLENEIFEDIAKYEEDFGKPFLYLGMDFREFITKQWDDRQAQKENEKIIRQKIRTKQIESEITLGTTSSKKHIFATPKSAPSKLFKSALGVPVYRTPNYSASKHIPNTVARMKINKKTTLQNDFKANMKNILKEKNENTAAGSSKHDSTTYTDFEANLNRSSRKVHRSSVLSSRKIVGTRTSNSKRKTLNKSKRKSVTKKASTSKMTPARGKLGMPFLI